MNPDDIFPLAQHLARPPKGLPEEAAYRGAVGRAYYFAFTAARDLLLKAGCPVPTDRRGHQVVSETLKRSAISDVRAAGALLIQLRESRNTADYDVGARATGATPVDRKRANLDIANANSIVGWLKSEAVKAPRMGIP